MERSVIDRNFSSPFDFGLKIKNDDNTTDKLRLRTGTCTQKGKRKSWC